jgi:N-methylhydantoinase A
MDTGGLLKVGPESAGARPGPICYGFGGKELTVTDANLFLGRLLPDRFMGGTMQLQQEEVNAKMTGLADQLGLDPVATALGIVRIVNASMAKAIRAVSLERGHDPKEFSLFSFGGASGLHCCELARELSIKKIIIPARAGILSAQGMVFAQPTLNYMQALFLIGNELKSPVLASKMKTLVDKGLEEAKAISRENGKDNISIEKFLNLRYQGQSYEICIPYKKDFSELFHLAHEHNFGYRLEEKPLELVSIQCSIRVNRTQRELPRKTLTRIKNILPLGEHPVYFENGPEKVSVFDRSDMTTGFTLAGPALVVDNYTTILLPVSFVLEVDELQNIIIQTS